VIPATLQRHVRSLVPALALPLLLTTAACDRDREAEAETRDVTASVPPAPAFPVVTDELLAAGAGQDWPTPGGNLENHNFSPLDQIHTGNVRDLVPVWIHSTGVEGALETAPVVVGNTLYATTAGGKVLALNAATGEQLWLYDPEPETVTLCCGPVNRGVSAWANMIYVSTLDARLVALDAPSGRPRWEVQLADPAAGYSAVMAPLAVNGRVFVGISGERYGIRGFVAAFDARTGEEIWRWHTVPEEEDRSWVGNWATTDPFGTPLGRNLDDERARVQIRADAWRFGGGGVSTTPAYDPTSRRLFINVEGPAPLIDGRERPGDNLYTGSIVALDARTGQMVWFTQYLPHDTWGLSGGSPPFVFERQGGRFVAFAGRTGWVYVFRAADGQPILRSDNFVPHESLFTRPGEEAIRMAPGVNGGNSGSPAAYDGRTATVFVGGAHQPMVYTRESQLFSRGRLWLGGTVRYPPDEEQWGTVTAIDLADGQIRWQRSTPAPVHSGALATAGNLVLVGQGSGTLDAFHASTGELLWQFNTGAGVHGSPVTYAVGGVQYLVVAAGGSHHFRTAPGDDLIAFALATNRPAVHVESYPTTTYQRYGPARGQPRDPPPPEPTVDDTTPPGPDTVAVDSPRQDR
jgi:alcohol dehydrogenase (cytochrome c)